MFVQPFDCRCRLPFISAISPEVEGASRRLSQTRTMGVRNVHFAARTRWYQAVRWGRRSVPPLIPSLHPVLVADLHLPPSLSGIYWSVRFTTSPYPLQGGLHLSFGIKVGLTVFLMKPPALLDRCSLSLENSSYCTISSGKCD